jgi:hypothetical protein
LRCKNPLCGLSTLKVRHITSGFSDLPHAFALQKPALRLIHAQSAALFDPSAALFDPPQQVLQGLPLRMSHPGAQVLKCSSAQVPKCPSAQVLCGVVFLAIAQAFALQKPALRRIHAQSAALFDSPQQVFQGLPLRMSHPGARALKCSAAWGFWPVAQAFALQKPALRLIHAQSAALFDSPQQVFQTFPRLWGAGFYLCSSR